MSSPVPKSLILFDGVCNLCNGFVQFVIKRDDKAKFMFGALQSEQAKEILSAHNVSREEIKTIVLIEEGRAFQKSTAGLKIISQLRGWGWTKILLIFPRLIRDFVYDIIAKYRYKIFGKKDACMIPTPELKSRFIDYAQNEPMNY